MPIAAECGSCHKRFKANEKLAGKKVNCPQCGVVIQIPMADPPKEDDAETYGLAKEPQAAAPAKSKPQRESPGNCPACNKPLTAEAVICVDCGFDLRSGRKIEAKPHPEHTIAADETDPSRPVVGTYSESWKDTAVRIVVLVILLGTASGGACGLGLVLGMHLPVWLKGPAGFMAFLFLGASIFWWLRLAVEALFEGVLCGLMFLFLPFYWLYYVATHWDEVETLFIIFLCATAMGWFFEGTMLGAMLGAR